MVVHDLRVAGRLFPGHHIAHDIGEGQGQVVGLALAQHLGQIPLGVCVQQVINALSASDYVLIPVQADYLAAEDMTELVGTVRSINTLVCRADLRQPHRCRDHRIHHGQVFPKIPGERDEPGNGVTAVCGQREAEL